MLLAHVGLAIVAAATTLTWTQGFLSVAVCIAGFHTALMAVQLTIRLVLRQHPWRAVRMTYFWTFATAILDRLLHHCDVISINGPSYRLKNRLAAIERDTDAA